MAQYRKKPVVIEAFQIAKSPRVAESLPAWAIDAINTGTLGVAREQPECFSIKTLEGVMLARAGDWIIQGVKGELYPVKDSIFQLTYEPVDIPHGGRKGG